jgi:hypothetical protein
MKPLGKRIGCPLLLSILLLPACVSYAAEKDAYWKWGWGAYGHSRNPLDVARYDWSMVNFGSVPADESTAKRCEAILELNPNHKFFLRLWPIMNLGEFKENRHQASLMHFIYRPKVREKVLAETRRQIKLIIDAVGPKAVVGMSFLEEMPCHFGCWRYGKKGDSPTWLINKFKKEITADLGHEFSFDSAEDRLWWGRKYADAICAVHKAMKEASGGRPVFFWQQIVYKTLDQSPTANPLDPNVSRMVPYSYAQIVKPGLCDGIFGYPNNAAVWKKQTQDIIRKYHCPFFSQTSIPALMRLCKLPEMVRMARWRVPENLGSFVFPYSGRGSNAWNDPGYLDGSRYFTSAETYRIFAWNHKVGLDVVSRALGPVVKTDYKAKGVKKGGFFHLNVQISNPGDGSWYGNDASKATFANLAVELKLNKGLSIPLSNNPGSTIKIGELKGGKTKVADWWVRVEDPAALAEGTEIFSITTRVKGRKPKVIHSSALTSILPSLNTRFPRRNGDAFIEPLYHTNSFDPVIAMTPLQKEVVYPGIEYYGRKITYHAILKRGERLVLGPKGKARLYKTALFDAKTSRFSRKKGDGSPSVFKSGYCVYRTGRVAVRSGAKFALTLTGSAEKGGNSLVVALLTGKTKGEPASKTISLLANLFSEKREKTLSAKFAVPEFDGGKATLQLLFYRFKDRGVVKYRRFSCMPVDASEAGVDVSALVDGVPPKIISRSFLRWIYHDNGDPGKHGNPKMSVRFFNPSDSNAGNAAEYIPGEFF